MTEQREDIEATNDWNYKDVAERRNQRIKKMKFGTPSI